MTFKDRYEAGRFLAASLTRFADADVVVLGLPRGGVVVASEVARALGAPLDVIVVRKLGVPFQPELAMGAIAEGGERVINDTTVRLAEVDPEGLAGVEGREAGELVRQASRFRADRAPVSLGDRTVIIVDDGIATGSTARVACRVARAQGAARVVVAAPVGPPGIQAELADVADEVVCPYTPGHFRAIGQWYDDFSATSDQEVVDLLKAADQSQRRNM
jgi:putative phosphoribosyl transferase